MEKTAVYDLLSIMLFDRPGVRPKHVMSFGMEMQTHQGTQQQQQTNLQSTEEI